MKKVSLIDEDEESVGGFLSKRSKTKSNKMDLKSKEILFINFIKYALKLKVVLNRFYSITIYTTIINDQSSSSINFAEKHKNSSLIWLKLVLM